MSNQSEKNPYMNVPNQGEPIEKDGKRYWWTFSNARVGSQDTSPQIAFAPHVIDPNSPIPEPYVRAQGNVLYGEPSEPRVIPCLGCKPVSVVPFAVCGMYYRIDRDIRCIDERETPDGRITLWEDSFPLSGFEQQCLAFRSKSVEEYEQLKKQAIKERQEERRQ